MTTDNINQANEADVVPKGFWRNAKGGFDPVSRIKDVDKLRDELVKRLCAIAEQESGVLTRLRQEAMAEVSEFIRVSAQLHGVKFRGEAGKGGVTLVSYDGKWKVQRSCGESIGFTEGVYVAKQLMEECLQAWGKGVNHNYRAVTDSAYELDASGRLSVSRLMGLRQPKIDDPKWHQALKILDESMYAVSSKMYIRFFKRDENGQYQPIPLDLTRV